MEKPSEVAVGGSQPIVCLRHSMSEAAQFKGAKVPTSGMGEPVILMLCIAIRTREARVAMTRRMLFKGTRKGAWGSLSRFL